MLYKKLVYIATIFSFCYVNIHAQTSLQIPSPNASSLGKFVDMPVSLFTGKPNINIPIYEIKEGNFSMPISLSYYPDAFNPNEQPGWVGQGWSLNAGGVITRKMRGFPDDYNYYADYISGSMPSVLKKGLFYGVYFDQYRHPKLNETYDDIISNGDDDSDEFIFNFNGYSGKFIFNKHSMSDADIIVIGNSGIKVEVYKDLYSENFQRVVTNKQNMVGLFYTYYPDQNLDNVPSYNTGMMLSGKFRTIKGFKITTPDGLQYEFGCRSDDTSSKLVAVERIKNVIDYNSNLVITNSWYLVRVLSANNKELADLTYESCGWSVEGNPMKEYPKKNIILNRSVGFKNISADKAFNVVLNASIIYPCYLKQIKTPNQIIDFAIQESNELVPNYRDIKENIANYMPGGELGSAFGNLGLQATTWGATEPNYMRCEGISNYQLNDITIRNINQTQINKFKFSYTSNQYERLRLLKLEEEGENPYLFDYNDRTNRFITQSSVDQKVPIIEYANLGIDAWGYYNGDEIPQYLRIYNACPSDYKTGEVPSNGGYSPYKKTLYRYNYCLDMSGGQSDLQMQDLENELSQYSGVYNNSTNYNFCLNKIIYPTTGYTKFEYEPHSYSYNIKRSSVGSISLEENNEEITGGLRIKKIEYFDNKFATLPVSSKQYAYEMGILTGIPIHYAEQSVITDFFGDNIMNSSIFSLDPIMPMCSNENGTYIGYSKVTETEEGYGKKEYFFSNFKDHPSLYSQSELAEGKDLHLDMYNVGYRASEVLFPLYANFPVNSFERERGLEIGLNIFDNSNNLKKTERKYYSKCDSYEGLHITSTCLKSLFFNHVGRNNQVGLFFGVNWIGIHVAIKDYDINYYPINLSKKIITDHYLTDNVRSQIDYSYDYDISSNNSFLTNETQMNSNGTKIEKKYTNIFSSYFVLPVSREMYDKQMIFKPVSEEIYKITPDNSKYLIGGSQIKYKDFGDSNYQPSEIFKFKSSEPVLSTSDFLSYGYGFTGFKLDTKIDNYDDMGNMLQFTDKSDLKESYYYAYNKTNPIIKATGVDNASLSAAVSSGLQQVGKSNIDELTTAIGNMTTEMQRNLWKSFVDKVLIYPSCSSAMMSFYTYSPLVGVSSITNQQGIATYYEYDDNNRLKQTYIFENGVKKILQDLQYNYKQ